MFTTEEKVKLRFNFTSPISSRLMEKFISEAQDEILKRHDYDPCYVKIFEQAATLLVGAKVYDLFATLDAVFDRKEEFDLNIACSKNYERQAWYLLDPFY